jgi:PAS domain S-box-containing protein
MVNTNKKPALVFWDIIASGLPMDYNMGVLSKLVMVNLLIITATPLLFIFGIVSLFEGYINMVLVDLTIMSFLFYTFIYLRKTKKLELVCNIGTTIFFLFFIFLFISGGVKRTALLWFYIFPIATLFIVGRRQASIWNLALFLTTVACALLSNHVDFITVYDRGLLFRFYGSYIAVFLLSFIFETTFQLVLHRERMTNENLTVVLEELQNTTVRKEYVENVINSLLDSLIVLSKDGRIVSSNDAACILLGYKEKELIGESLAFILANDPFKEMLEKNEIIDLLKAGESSLFECSFRTKQGANIPVLFSGSLILDESGGIKEIACVAVDLRSQKKIEEEKLDLQFQLQQSQKMEAVGTLVSGIAHDFNNIIGTIKGFTKLLLERDFRSKEESEYLNTILGSSDRASSLVSQLLTFSRIDDSHQEVIPLAPLLRETLKMMRAVLPANIEIKQEIKPTEISILANATHIHQILVNICTNAGHAMKEKGGVLEVRLSEKDALSDNLPEILEKNDAGYVELMIIDTGIGMTAEVKECIFDPFFTTKAINEGTGLGLSMVHGLIKSHKGTVTVDSTPGVGTEFSIYFPIAATKTDTISETNKSEAQKGSGNILLVEDEISLSKYYQIALTNLGYKITLFNDPLAAVQTFEKSPYEFSLVFTDLSMPRMTGLELSREIKKIDPALPIIIASGYQTEAQRQEAAQLGVDHFILKPVNILDLSHIIHATINQPKKDIFQKTVPEPPQMRPDDHATEDDSQNAFIDDELISLILPQFHKDRHEDANQIAMALKEENYELIADIGHKIAGSAEAFGFTEYHEVAVALQQAARDSNKSDIHKYRDKLLNCLNKDQKTHGLAG